MKSVLEFLRIKPIDPLVLPKEEPSQFILMQPGLGGSQQTIGGTLAFLGVIGIPNS